MYTYVNAPTGTCVLCVYAWFSLSHRPPSAALSWFWERVALYCPSFKNDTTCDLLLLAGAIKLWLSSSAMAALWAKSWETETRSLQHSQATIYYQTLTSKLLLRPSHSLFSSHQLSALLSASTWTPRPTRTPFLDGPRISFTTKNSSLKWTSSSMAFTITQTMQPWPLTLEDWGSSVAGALKEKGQKTWFCVFSKWGVNSLKSLSWHWGILGHCQIHSVFHPTKWLYH